MTLSLCDDLAAFLGGELEEVNAEAFRNHIASCETCDLALHERMMMEAVEQTDAPALRTDKIRRATAGAGGAAGGPSGGRRLARAAVTAMFISTLAAGWFLWMRAPPDDGGRKGQLAALSIESASTRPSEVRLAYGPADAYRPYDVSRGSDERHHEEVPLTTLAALEANKDWQGLAAGLLLTGDDSRADSYLAKAAPSVGVLADRAAVLLDRGKNAEALAALDAVLAKEPKHPQALFNRGLALRNLELPLAAAEMFDRVVALGEKGWAEEAKKEAGGLRAVEERRQKLSNAAGDAADAMATGGPVVPDGLTDAYPATVRRGLYHAVRGATSKERVLDLLPLARRLDKFAGGHVLENYVARSSTADFTKRAKWATRYTEMFKSEKDPSPAEVEAFGASLKAAGEDDMLFGAYTRTEAWKGRVADLSRIASSSDDPFFGAAAAQYRAEQAIDLGDYSMAAMELRGAIAKYGPLHVDYPVNRLEQTLAWLLSSKMATEMMTNEARAVALRGLARSRAFVPEDMRDFMSRLANISRERGSVAQLMAYAREGELLGGTSCFVTRDLRLEVARGLFASFDVEGGDRELAAAPRCDRPITLLAADLIASSTRMGGRPAGAANLLGDLAAARERFSGDQKAFADAIRAAFLFGTDGAAGEKAAREALTEANALPSNHADARKVQIAVHRMLAVAAATQENAEAALSEIAEAAGGSAAPEGCALGLAIDDDRAIAVTRDPGGLYSVETTKLTSSSISPDRLVSKGLIGKLAHCPEVAAYALPPIHGLARLLPPELAWGYASRPHLVPSATLRRLVVSAPEPPADLGLPRLGSWGAPPEGAAWIHGNEATPRAVLAGLETATEVEIHAHGIVDAVESAASVIALSPESDGKYALSASDIEKANLRGHPIVVLGACHAATTAGYLHEAWSLPAAFVRAGARAVFGSPNVIADVEARPFFDAVLARIRTGSAPSVALRDERVLWLSRDPKSWVVDVIEFE